MAYQLALNLNYKYDANVESNVEYEYSVKGFLEATYTKDSEVQKVWEKEYSLLDTKKETKKAKTGEEWYAGETKLTTAPKDAGTYTVKVLVAETPTYVAASREKEIVRGIL